MYKYKNFFIAGICFFFGCINFSNAQIVQPAQPAQPTQPAPVVRLRGTIVEAGDRSFVFKERGGEIIRVATEEQLSVQEVYPIEMSKIERNSYIGTAALADKNGRLVALEVHVFPESMRGTGEGHRPWDSVPGSTMTNANVDELVSIGAARELHLKYKDGEKIVYVPESVPIVSYRPGSRTLLVPGANAVVMATEKDGKPTTSRVMVGRDGFKPPM